MSGYETILYAEDGPVGTLTLNQARRTATCSPP